MSQENRDERLGLTGLTPEQRRRRIEELEREIAQRRQAAKVKLQAARAQKKKEFVTSIQAEQTPPCQ